MDQPFIGSLTGGRTSRGNGETWFLSLLSNEEIDFRGGAGGDVASSGGMSTPDFDARNNLFMVMIDDSQERSAMLKQRRCFATLFGLFGP